ncbi:MAG: S-layer homology domain-containing protein [Candidatus Limnocylindrales bacterium]
MLTVLLTAPAVVLASHQFNDVPDSNPFHNEISAIAGAGITGGFGDGGYHPGDSVTRQAMAAFMQRGFGRTALAIGQAPLSPSVFVPANSFQSPAFWVRQVTITVPGATNAFSPQQLVHLQGRVQLDTSMDTSPKGCPCEFAAYIRDTTTATSSTAQFATFESSTTSAFTYTFDVDALFAAPPGARTYRLDVFVNARNNATNAATFELSGLSSLSAMTFPFGPAGGNTP